MTLFLDNNQIKKNLLLFIVSFFALGLSAQDSIYYVDYIAEREWNNYLFVIEDTANQWNINDVRNKKFIAFNADNKLNEKSAYWAKLSIRNNSNRELSKILIIGKKRHADFSEMYLYIGDSLIKYVQSGYFVAGKQKEIAEELGSKFQLELLPNTDYDVYLYIRNISKFKPDFRLSFIQPKLFYQQISQRNLLYGIVLGVLWIMLFYNLLVYVYSYDMIYVFYSIYVLGMVFNISTERGLFIEYIIPDFPSINPYIFILATGIALTAYFQFVRLFLDTKEKMPIWNKIILWIIYGTITITAVLLMIILLNFNLPLVISVSNGINLISLLFGFVFLIYLSKFRNKLALFFMIGTIFLVVGSITSIVLLLLKIELGIESQHFMNIGVIGQILFFSLGLGFKIRVLEEEQIKVQDELIVQLMQNEELKEKVNRELEVKVKERTLELEAKKEILEITNRKITDSINSARRIQAAMLPNEKNFKKCFDQHFIFFKPRDIVSGDFYWIKKVENHIVVVAADSTGHGVPGALISMLGISLLNDIVGKSGIIKASEVLETLRNEVKISLKQNGTSGEQKEGMDMAFCAINLDTKKMQYAGANRPLLLIRNNTDELIHIKPNSQPVSIYRKEVPFVNHELQLLEGDVLYFFSDGYADQFGGKRKEKFKTKRLKELFLTNHKKNMSEQKQLLEKKFEQWKGSNGQIDDVLVMGIRI